MNHMQAKHCLKKIQIHGIHCMWYIYIYIFNGIAVQMDDIQVIDLWSVVENCVFVNGQKICKL